ncbi:restriction endonuclease subunit S [Mycobacterium sp. 48b]|uniref:restriction endonuclease subunit S n=1 Tax=Mycobacterium sp. 48b TaxID=3400426 RepID=UPI003AB02C68
MVSGWHNEAPVKGPGFVIGRATNLGRPTWSDEDFWPLNTVLYAKDFLGNHPKFAYYWFLTTDLSAYNSGSVQPMLNRNYIANIPVDVPPVDEQRVIAATLGAIDEKIESNQRQRGLLRKLGAARLFGAVAEGGVERPLRSVTMSIARGAAPRYADNEISAPLVLNQKCIRDGWVSLAPARRTQNRVVAPAKKASGGDILVNSTGVGTLGRVARWHEGSVFVDSHVSVVKPELAEVGPTVLAYAMLVRVPEIEALGEGSTGQTELSPTRLGELQVLLPDAAKMAVLEVELLAIERHADHLAIENDRLAAVRDALLPELLSGRIRVPIEEAP